MTCHMHMQVSACREWSVSGLALRRCAPQRDHRENGLADADPAANDGSGCHTRLDVVDVYMCHATIQILRR